MFFSSLSFVALLEVSIFISNVAPTTDVFVHTLYGQVQGFRTDRANVFYGIPYAGPPTGSLRWHPPAEPKSWSPNVYHATKHQPACPQPQCDQGNPKIVCPDAISEDCLYLNIWTPLPATSNSSYPVMVFLHGGNFVSLSGSSKLFDGEYFAMKGRVVLVNIDYRLGMLGFMYTGSGLNDARGNYGIMDQRQALKWVQANIRQFGGNPKQVTLFGQSAGAQSTLVHLMSPKSAPYFHQVIVESAPNAIPYHTQTDAIKLSHVFAKDLECKRGDMECLRSKPWKAIVRAQQKSRSIFPSKTLQFFEPIGPVVDGDEVPMQPMEAALYNKFRSVPVIIGTVSEECRLYVYGAFKQAMEKQFYYMALFLTFPSSFLQILSKYHPKEPDCRQELSYLFTDFIFTCSSRNIARNLIGEAGKSAYMYEFDHVISFAAWRNSTCCQMCHGHVCHGSELVFVFHTAAKGGYQFSAEEEKMSNLMLAYWTNFAHSSDPSNGPVQVENWPRYDEGSMWPMMKFKTPHSSIIHDYRSSACNFWDKIGYTALSKWFDRIVT